MKHAILMGDPAHFSVVGGANPHTRDRYGRRKSVDRALAIRQWQRMRDRLQELGFHVEVLPPDPKFPGLVYPANYGFRHGDVYVLSTLTPTRRGEQPAYRKALEGLGLRCYTVQSLFEGEADLFPAGDHLLFTHGTIERQRFVLRFGWPPYKRIYGFRSDPRALDEIAAIRPFDRPLEKLRLVDERYYHGDTCLCSFGPGRRELLAYLPVLAPEAVARLRALFPNLIAIDDDDAAIYACNSFAFERGGEHFLLMPEGISGRLESCVQERGVRVLKADVSEFHKKGGGSVKCMIGDVGKLYGMLGLRIRPIALGLIWNGDGLLVEHGFDSVKREAWFRPPGGGIEFGERASDTLRRELREELGAELLEPRLVGVLENIFQYEGRSHHEIAFVLEAEFADAQLYERAQLEIQESEQRVLASWKSLRELDASPAPLYPEGLRELLRSLGMTHG